MLRFRNFLPLVALLVGSVVLGGPTQARAGFAITVFVDGVNQGVSLDASSNANSFSVSNAVVSNFTVSISALTNWAGDPDGALMSTSSNNHITTNFGASGGTHTIAIVISEDGWLAPASSPVTLSTSAGGSIGNIGSATKSVTVDATNQGFLDNSGGNAAATTLSPSGAFTPLQTASASKAGTGTKPLIYGPDPADAGNLAGGTPFTLTQVYSFKFTTNSNNNASADVSGSVTVAVPAPAGLVLALTGLPLLGVGTWLRRRRASV